MGPAAAILIPTIASGIVYFIGKSAGYSQVIERLNYDFKVKELKLSTSGLSITIDFWLDNPTEENMTISYPFVMVYYGTMWVVQNNIQTQNGKPRTFQLKKYSQVTIPQLHFEIPLLKIASLLAVDISIILQAVTTGDYSKINTYVDTFKQKLTFTASFEINNLPITYKDTLLGLGYSPVSAIDRPISEIRGFDRLIPLPKGEKKLVLKNGSVKDTVREMYKMVESDYLLLSKLAPKLKGANVYQTSKNTFDFIYKYIKYNLEEGEQLRNPATTYHLGQRLAREFYRKNGFYSPDYSADCDDISIFVASLLKNLGINFAFRIAAYGGNFSHVYVIAFDETGKPIIIDPVFYEFNAEKKYSRQITYDKNMKTLNGIPVYALSGETRTNLDDIILDFLKQSRDVIAHRPRRYRSSAILVQMFNYVIKYWNTPQREKALRVIVEKEKALLKQGLINCPYFFKELESLNGIGLGSFWDKTKTWLNKAKTKLQKLSKNNPANNPTNNTNVPDVTPPPPPPSADNNDNDSAKKTVRDVIAKYKVPIAIGVFVTTGGIVIATSPSLQEKLGIRKK